MPPELRQCLWGEMMRLSNLPKQHEAVTKDYEAFAKQLRHKRVYSQMLFKRYSYRFIPKDKPSDVTGLMMMRLLRLY